MKILLLKFVHILLSLSLSKRTARKPFSWTILMIPVYRLTKCQSRLTLLKLRFSLLYVVFIRLPPLSPEKQSTFPWRPKVDIKARTPFPPTKTLRLFRWADRNVVGPAHLGKGKWNRRKNLFSICLFTTLTWNLLLGSRFGFVPGRPNKAGTGPIWPAAKMNWPVDVSRGSKRAQIFIGIRNQVWVWDLPGLLSGAWNCPTCELDVLS